MGVGGQWEWVVNGSGWSMGVGGQWQWVVNALLWLLYLWERDPVPIVLTNYNWQYFDVEFFYQKFCI
jgi:hypothetical protein